MKKTISIVAVFCILAAGGFSYSADKADGYKVGDRVADFTIDNYDGKSYTLSSNGAKVTAILFLSTECPFVQPYTERLNALGKEFSDKGVAMWGINSNKTEPVEEVSAHAKDKAYVFPVIKDMNNVIADQFGAQRTPEVFLIDNSTMTVIYHGRIDDNKEADKVTSNDLKNAIDQFLNGQEVAVKETKAFGCSVKR